MSFNDFGNKFATDQEVASLVESTFRQVSERGSQLTLENVRTVIEIGLTSLYDAELVWNAHGNDLIRKESALLLSDYIAKSIQSHIPSHTLYTEPKVDNFIAIVMDMRDSTNHLKSPTSGGIINGLQRVLYETSILLPTLSEVIYLAGGGVTEFLGDGFLGYFQVPSELSGIVISNAYIACQDCFHLMEILINPILNARYGLPALEIGIGMAYSKALVTAVGPPRHRQVKVFGECVYEATKLSDTNELLIDPELNKIWPVATGNQKAALTMRKVTTASGRAAFRPIENY